MAAGVSRPTARGPGRSRPSRADAPWPRTPAMASSWATMGSMAPPSTAPVELDQPTGDVDVVPDRPWVVIVWNDPINLMSYVTYVLQKLFGYAKEKAESLMWDVHTKGRAVVSSGPREKAEIDVFRLHEHGLWATMQHDE